MTKKIFEITECTNEYWEFIRKLRNNKEVSRGFIEQNYITKKQQIEYMDKYSHYFRVALVNKNPAGYFGVIEGDIRICTHPDFQLIGLGKFMLKELKKIWPDSFAKIKVDNEASRKLFESAGYTVNYLIMEDNKSN